MRITLDTPFVYGAVDKIFLDGVQQTGCVMADDVEGVVERYKTDKKGKFISDGESYMMEVIIGKVEIKFNLGWRMEDGRVYIDPIAAGTYWKHDET